MMDKEQWIGVVGAVGLHLALLALLMIELPQQRPAVATSSPAEPVIQARAVTEDEVMAPARQREAEEAERQQRVEAERRAAEERRRAEAQRKVEEQRKAEELRKVEEQRQVEERRKTEQRLAEARKQAEAEARRQAEEAVRKKAEAEARRQAEEEARKKAEAEARRQAEEAARKKAEEEARKKAEAEARRQALQAQLDAEQRRLDEEAQRQRQDRLARLRNEYVAQISDKVRRNWLRPDGSRGTLCTVLINQLPDGEVVGVQVTQCDGDAAFQRSVENAVYRASPLPLPADRELFSREIQFNFRPN